MNQVNDDKIVLTLDRDKEKAPSPSITDVDNFIGAFKLLFDDFQCPTEVEARQGSVKVIVACVTTAGVLFAPVTGELIRYALNKPKTHKQREASDRASQVTNNYYISVGGERVNPQPKPLIQKLVGVEYQVITHDEKVIIHYDENNNSSEESKGQKVDAFIEILSGEYAGRRGKVRIPQEYINRNVHYISSFEVKNDQLKLIDKPMLLPK